MKSRKCMGTGGGGLPAFGLKTVLRAIRAEKPSRREAAGPGLDAERGLDSAPRGSSMAADSVEPSMMVAGPKPYGKCRLTAVHPRSAEANPYEGKSDQPPSGVLRRLAGMRSHAAPCRQLLHGDALSRR